MILSERNLVILNNKCRLGCEFIEPLTTTQIFFLFFVDIFFILITLNLRFILFLFVIRKEKSFLLFYN